MYVSVCSCLFVPVRACKDSVCVEFGSVSNCCGSFDVFTLRLIGVTAARHPQSAATHMDACWGSSESPEIDMNVCVGGPKLASCRTGLQLSSHAKCAIHPKNHLFLDFSNF